MDESSSSWVTPVLLGCKWFVKKSTSEFPTFSFGDVLLGIFRDNIRHKVAWSFVGRLLDLHPYPLRRLYSNPGNAKTHIIMNLDDLDTFKSIDTSNLLSHIDALPDQFEAAWAYGQGLLLPNLEGVTQVVVCGMGAAADAAMLVAALTERECLLPVHLCNTHTLPVWASGSHTLVIACGDEEETLSALQLARAVGCQVMTVETSPSKMLAAGHYLPILLALFTRAGWVSEYGPAIGEAADAMRQQQQALWAASPVMKNPAKRMAGQFMNRFVLVFGAGLMGAAAHYWAGRVQRYAKAWAQAETLPAAAHTSIFGTLHPDDLITKYMFITLEAESLDPRDRALSGAVREHFMTSGFNTDFIRGVGPSPLAHLLTSLHYGEYVSYYLAMAYGVEPGSY
jgi:glucose/mannose-6-phosphate isomerase